MTVPYDSLLEKAFVDFLANTESSAIYEFALFFLVSVPGTKYFLSDLVVAL